jgi:hypothetical protein
MGDTYLCREHYTLHKFGELTSDEEPCDICADRDAQDPVALNCILNHPQSCECA